MCKLYQTAMFQLNTNFNCIEKATKHIQVKNKVTEIWVIRFSPFISSLYQTWATHPSRPEGKANNLWYY